MRLLGYRIYYYCWKTFLLTSFHASRLPDLEPCTKQAHLNAPSRPAGLAPPKTSLAHAAGPRLGGALSGDGV